VNATTRAMIGILTGFTVFTVGLLLFHANCAGGVPSDASRFLFCAFLIPGTFIAGIALGGLVGGLPALEGLWVGTVAAGAASSAALHLVGRPAALPVLIGTGFVVCVGAAYVSSLDTTSSNRPDSPQRIAAWWALLAGVGAGLGAVTRISVGASLVAAAIAGVVAGAVTWAWSHNRQRRLMRRQTGS
jgi:hypothetical protein